MNHDLLQITEKIAGFIAREETEGKLESEFNALALQVFECQYRLIEPYRKLCDRRGRTPENVKSWTDIPAVPAEAFKRFFLFAGEGKDIAKTFRSSGTTQPGSNSQAHFSREGLNLMNRSVEANARRRLFPDGGKSRIFVLAPRPSAAPHLIMVEGMSHLLSRFGAEDSRFCMGAGGLEIDALLSDLKQCCERNLPVTLMGSSFGFVHLFDEMELRKLRFKLPEGSRLMDAGGYKGRSREIGRGDFVLWAQGMLGLEPQRIVNLLGMTEMASQIYDGVPDKSFTKTGNGRHKETPHWVRTQVMNPSRLRNGEMEKITETDKPGLLRHLDLANVERPMVIQTEDVGVLRGLGFEVLKRVKGAEPRGCSMTLEEFTARSA